MARFIKYVFFSQNYLSCLDANATYIDWLSGEITPQLHSAITEAALPSCQWTGINPLPESKLVAHDINLNIQVAPVTQPEIPQPEQNIIDVKTIQPTPVEQQKQQPCSPTIELRAISQSVIQILNNHWRKPILISEAVQLIKATNVRYELCRHGTNSIYFILYGAHGGCIRVPEDENQFIVTA